MKKLLFLLTFSVLTNFVKATTFYVSPTGADSNPGTNILQPFKTLTAASKALVLLPSKGAGDIVYVRNGTYTGWPTAGPANGYAQMLMNNIHGTADAWCTVTNYPGEVPVFDYSSVIPNSTRPSPTGLSIFNSTYLIVRGIRLTGYRQIANGSGVSRGLELNNCQHILIEQCTVDHFQGTGFFISGGGADTKYLNCDAHHNEDRLSADGTGVPGSDAFDNADGWGITGAGNNTTTITFEGCRAWLNGDDGWDNFGTDGTRFWKNCWAFWNGYYQDPGMPTKQPAGNGQGFKLGPCGQDLTGTDHLRDLSNCLAFENRAHGFDQNGAVTTRMRMLNCTAYGNGGYGFQFQYYASTPGIILHTFKNNAALSNTSGNVNLASAAATNISNNSWNGGVAISSADFQSVSSVGMDGARQADGSLPDLTFLKLAGSSDLINAGTPVGIPYVSTNPDMGAYEYTTGAPDVLPTANAGSDQTYQLPITSTINLNGSGTGVATLSYLWTPLSGGTLSSTTITNPTVTLTDTGRYKFVLRVTDGNSVVVRDTMEIVITSVPNSIKTSAELRSVKLNRQNKLTIDYTAKVTANSLTFKIQRKYNTRGAVYTTIESIPAIAGQTQYKPNYYLPTGTMVRFCPVDKQGTPDCSNAVPVKKN